MKHVLLPVTCMMLITGCTSTPESAAPEGASSPVHVDPFLDGGSAESKQGTEAAAEQPAADSPRKVVVLDIGQLPLRTYSVGSSATEFMASDEQFGVMAEQLRIDIGSDIDSHQIRDANGLKQLHSTLMNIAIFQEEYPEARRQIELIRGLETSEAREHTTGLMMGAIIDAWENGGRSNPASMSLYERYLRERLRAMPWEVVKADIIARQRNAGQMNQEIFQAIISTGLDPMFEEDGTVDSTVARQLVTLKSIIDLQMPVMESTSMVYQEAIDAHAGD